MTVIGLTGTGPLDKSTLHEAILGAVLRAVDQPVEFPLRWVAFPEGNLYTYATPDDTVLLRWTPTPPPGYRLVVE